MRPEDVTPDDRGSGLLRARPIPFDRLGDPSVYDLRTCRIHDMAAPGGLVPDLLRNGFSRIELGSIDALQAVLAQVRAAGRVSDEESRTIRRQLAGRSFPLAGGRRLKILHVTPEGFLMRKAGPNGLALERDASLRGMNGHDAAQAVHTDQDVRGTPVRQIFRGAAPYLFRHDSPYGRNFLSPFVLVNMWIPLQQPTRPLALMDRRTLDRRRHQLRYALATDRFLERDADRTVNDIWMHLHDEGQQWHFTSQMDHRQAYVFETMGTPHGSFVLPGEARAEALYRRLDAARTAVQAGDGLALEAALGACALPADAAPATEPLRRAIAAMESVLAEAGGNAQALCRGDGAQAWLDKAASALQGVVRMSLEMRGLAVIVPQWWGLSQGKGEG